MFFDDEFSILQDLSDVAHKPISAPRHRLNELMTVVIQHFPQHGNVLRQVSIFDERVRPDFLHQFFFLDNVTTVSHQQQEEVKLSA